MKRIQRVMTAALLTLGMFSWVKAQVDEIRNEPGYVDLEWVSIPPGAKKVTDVRLGPRLIHMVEKAEERRRATELHQRVFKDRQQQMEKAQEELERRLVSLQVKAFGVDSATALKIKPVMIRIEKNLDRERWTPVIRLKQDVRVTNVSVKFGDDRKIEGIFIMSLDPDSGASFVNLIGDVDLDRLRNIRIDMDINAMDSLRQAAEKHQRGK
jgi:hypothetical protein